MVTSRAVSPHSRFVVAGYDVVVLARKTISELLDDNILRMSAAAAYSFFFSLFPTFLLIAPVLSTFGNRQKLFNSLFSLIARSLPPSALALVEGVLGDVVFSNGAPGLMSVGALLALFAGANMFSTLAGALNDAYEVHETRPWWRVQLIGVGATIVCAVTIGGSVALLMGGGELLRWFATAVSLGGASAAISAVVQYALTIALMLVSVWAIYMFLPDVQAHNRLQTLVGAAFATGLWIMVTLLFRSYVTHFGTYNRTYGTIGAVIVLLSWMYLSMLTVLLGGELNSELRRGTGTAALKDQGLTAGSGAGGRVPTHDGIPHASC
ncbi:MAG: YihY/virulence factor BrkB family protein [Gemmatimonadota bacterium]|nr:YihY/virulence factor BrkB family protein [Gemmatimonadota bacterium]